MARNEARDDSDPLAELQRRAFVRNLGKYPMYRIV